MTQRRVEAFLTIADEELAAAQQLHAVLPGQAFNCDALRSMGSFK
jgi:hypothetical protein